MSPTRVETVRSTLIPSRRPAPLNTVLIKHEQERRPRRAKSDSRHGHPLRRLYDVRLRAHNLVRGVDRLARRAFPFWLLTMIVSLEAIFLSTFVLISQPADAKRQVVADQQWRTVQEEDQQNRELLDLSNQILDLTKAVHAYARAAAELRPAGGERRDATGRQS